MKTRQLFARHGTSLLTLWISTCLLPAGYGVEFWDDFNSRETVSDATGEIEGNNASATLEAGEPRHGNKIGGHSVWISWTAPTTGIVTFETAGSDFDTLLSAYVLEENDPGQSPFERIREVARSDDDGADTGSVIQFGAFAGTTYEIAVDGYGGATGNIRLRWDLIAITQPPPVILAIPPDQSLRIGDALTLSVAIQTTDELGLKWFFNDTELETEEESFLTILNFRPANVGQYRLRLTVDDVRFFTNPIEIQVNSDGVITALARDKLIDATESGLESTPLAGINLQSVQNVQPRLQAQTSTGVARGFNGTQIFNTVYAKRDEGEPLHCGISGGASYWFSYQPPADGILELNTDGSDYDTVLAVYTYVVESPNYEDLIPVVCDDNSGSNSITSRVIFDVTQGSRYAIAVDGVDGARGIAYLNYQLFETQTGLPEILSSPVSQAVAVGGTIDLLVSVSSESPLNFQWYRDSFPVPETNNVELQIENAQTVHSGVYTVEVSNSIGKVFSQSATVKVLNLPVIEQVTDRIVALSGSTITLCPLVTGDEISFIQWSKNGATLENQSNPTLILSNVQIENAGSYTLKVGNAVGLIESGPVELLIVGVSEIQFDSSINSLTLVWAVSAGLDYIIESSDELTNDNWNIISEGRSQLQGITFTDQPDSPTRFYRLRFP